MSQKSIDCLKLCCNMRISHIALNPILNIAETCNCMNKFSDNISSYNNSMNTGHDMFLTNIILLVVRVLKMISVL